jgi:hypothetical protein
MRRQRTFNVEIGVFGNVGTGKTEKALEEIIKIQKREPIYVVAHDLSYNIPEKLHDGNHTRVHRYRSIQEAEKAIVVAAGGIHAIACRDASEVVDLGKRVAHKSLLRHTPGATLAAKEKAIQDGNGVGIPCIVYFDEIVNAEQASRYRIGDELGQFIAQRRHLHCGLIFTSQFPRQCHYSLGTMATDIIFFNLDSEKDIKKLYEDFGVPEEIARKARSLKGHQYIHVNRLTKQIVQSK